MQLAEVSSQMQEAGAPAPRGTYRMPFIEPLVRVAEQSSVTVRVDGTGDMHMAQPARQP